MNILIPNFTRNCLDHRQPRFMIFKSGIVSAILYQWIKIEISSDENLFKKLGRGQMQHGRHDVLNLLRFNVLLSEIYVTSLQINDCKNFIARFSFSTEHTFSFSV